MVCETKFTAYVHKKRLEQWRPTSDTKFVSNYFPHSKAISELIVYQKL